jgi:hypothetical protein
MPPWAGCSKPLASSRSAKSEVWGNQTFGLSARAGVCGIGRRMLIAAMKPLVRFGCLFEAALQSCY